MSHLSSSEPDKFEVPLLKATDIFRTYT